MKTAIIQHTLRWNDVEGNLRHITELMDDRQGADLYVLSETFATGFLAESGKGNDRGSDCRKEDEEQNDRSSEWKAAIGRQGERMLIWMEQQARRLDAAVAGSVATTDADGQLRNRLYFVRPDGSYDYYDKRHLFSYAGETDAYVAGRRRVVVAWRGVRFLLQVCYDLRFPVFSRRTLQHDVCHANGDDGSADGNGDYDAILYVANWPKSRREVWQTLLRARALENQCFVVGVNVVGNDGVSNYVGDSVIIDAYGHTVAACTPGEAGSAAHDLDMSRLEHFRQKFPVIDDADRWLLI